MSRGNDVTEWQCDFCQKTATSRIGGTPPDWVEIKVNEPVLLGTWALCSLCWKQQTEIRSAMERHMQVYGDRLDLLRVPPKNRTWSGIL